MSEKGRKVTPKTQRQISNDFIEPYDISRGNPNSNPTNEIEGGETFVNRANELSYKGDDTKLISLGLLEIDESIMYYFNNVIRLNVLQNNQIVPVPIIYGDPERWAAVQKSGFLRDKNGKLMAPIVMFRRKDITKVRNLSNKLDANYPQNFHILSKKYNQRNSYDNFSVLTNRKPQKTYYAVIVPDYVEVKYECIIFTYYTKQMNKIIESMNYASDSYWGDPERFKFRTTINSFNQTTEVIDGQDRAVKSSFNLTLYGYIVPDSINKDLAHAKTKFNDKSKVVIFTETVDNINNINLYHNLENPPQPSIPSDTPILLVGILTENGDFILSENGNYLIQE